MVLSEMEMNNFDVVLGLEEGFYSDGFQQGLEAGTRAGRIEGRTFGLEKGFEKYVKSGRLYGRSIIWANRMPRPGKGTTLDKENAHQSETPISLSSPDHERTPSSKLQPLPDNHRLAHHLRILHALTESASLSTENTEDAVSNFDDRFKRAQGKVKLVERILGEGKVETRNMGTPSRISVKGI